MAANSPNAEPRTSWCERGDGGVLGRLGAADPDARQARSRRASSAMLGAGEREADVGGAEAARRREARTRRRAAAIADVAGRDAGERGGEVVADVEHESELDGASRGRAPGASSSVGAQDQQRRGDVAELERGDRRRTAAQAARAAPAARGCGSAAAHARVGPWRRADRVDDRERGEQAGDDAERASRVRMPTSATSPIASSGPPIAPRLSIARSNP